LAALHGFKREHLAPVYFDTRNLALRDHGVSLRVRRNGQRRLQTIKANSTAPIVRGEWEAEIDRDRPNLEMASGTALAPILTDKIAQHLKPMVETRIERTLASLHVGRSEIELAFDVGRVMTTDSSVDIAEIEIELRRGERRDMAQLARRLVKKVRYAQECFSSLNPDGLGRKARRKIGRALKALQSALVLRTRTAEQASGEMAEEEIPKVRPRYRPVVDDASSR